MHFDQTVETELASRLELIELGSVQDESRTSTTAEIVDLLNLAHQLRALPPVEPDRRWMESSKRRLMARFEAVQGQANTSSAVRPLP